MKLKHIVTVALATTALLALSACSNSKSSSTSEVQKIKDKGTLVVATAADYAPFEFQMVQNGKNVVVGSDIDMANQIAKDLGVKLKIENMDFNNVLTTVQSGKADLAIAGINANPTREKSFDFSVPYYNDINVVMVQKSKLSDYKTKSALNGKQVAVQTSSMQQTIAQTEMTKSTVVSLANINDEVTELTSGKVNAVVIDQIVAKQYVSENPNLAITSLTYPYPKNSSGVAIAMKKNSGDLKTKIDSIVKAMKADGTITKYINNNITLANQAKSK
ncbi:MAG: transporter substrate-binding domain-containing protein [Streptococcaceae bacterium]|jgi:polar amino acid transport system substrate-binding protein|nr:transporter substrate-binding domain-containing protein [Streptococcaceae bacterium]